ncbi:DNA polymerase III subunit delta' [Dehalobacter sp. DCM]|uniref:DNA polymerase III subunit delta' n=1 Tax=Dehalobacter sp. DCM TaxID=2907827 RepID=UPI003081B7D0|nr:DNA polymerase III subunit delta' [Dehalobacter sp. DCM]
MGITFDLLAKAAREEKLAHFLLFHGSGTIEREKAVLELALMLNCLEESDHKSKPCRECMACKKILSGNHPDIYLVRPPKTSIGIEQITQLQEKLYRKTYDGKYRVCLLDQAEKLTLPAANALLKITEEPPANTVIVLSTANAEGIITTLRSRAQEVFFSPPDEGTWAEEIEAFRLSGGDPDLARKIQEAGITPVKNRISLYLEMITQRDFLKMFNLFPMERDESVLFLQVLAVAIKEKILRGEQSPEVLKEIIQTTEMIRRQVNHRLVLEVLALKHLRLGGTDLG